MADIEPPSFSLGLDLDSSICGPHNPNPDPDPDPLTHPSFSLGLEFEPQNGGVQNNTNNPFAEKEEEGIDLDPDPDPDPDLDPFTNPSFSLGLEFEPQHGGAQNNNTPLVEEDEEEGFGLQVSDSDPDDRPGPVLRRLRRGGPGSEKKKKERVLSDDDIEEFSSQEFESPDDPPALRNNTLCSSSKVPLSGCGILKSQRDNDIHSKKRKQHSSCPSTTTREKSTLSDLSASPLRKFQLLDSDSDLDNPSETVHNRNNASVVGSSKQDKRKRSIQGYFQFKPEKKTHSSTPFSEKKDLWEDFYEDKTRSVSTPAFDEFCKEYFSAVKPKKGASCSVTECSNLPGKNVNFTNKMTQQIDVDFSGPPSHRYFFHDDLRIQNLVRNRLPYFCPLDGPGDLRSEPFDQSGIDYMRQFGHESAAKQQTGKHSNARRSSQRSQFSQGTAAKRSTAKRSNAGKAPRRSGKRVNSSNGEGTSHASGDWVNPRQVADILKDAGRRRVHADGQSPGHWLTAENGKKVYVTRDGKELTGRQAYTHYRKESGKGFKGNRKKTSKRK